MFGHPIRILADDWLLAVLAVLAVIAVIAVREACAAQRKGGKYGRQHIWWDDAVLWNGEREDKDNCTFDQLLDFFPKGLDWVKRRTQATIKAE